MQLNLSSNRAYVPPRILVPPSLLRVDHEKDVLDFGLRPRFL